MPEKEYDLSFDLPDGRKANIDYENKKTYPISYEYSGTIGGKEVKGTIYIGMGHTMNDIRDKIEKDILGK